MILEKVVPFEVKHVSRPCHVGCLGSGLADALALASVGLLDVNGRLHDALGYGLDPCDRVGSMQGINVI